MFTYGNPQPRNRAFLYGDAVQVSFFIRNSQLIMAEECYFFLMASMRKMRMNIPLTYTLEFFQNLFTAEIIAQDFHNGIIHFMAYRDATQELLSEASVSLWFSFLPSQDVLALQKEYELDLMKEINVNTNLLSNIRVHCPENIYAEIYARENDLDDVILLNPQKRIARSISGNLMFLAGNEIKVAKQTEGAYISPLMENFVTFLHRSNLAVIEPSEMVAFESQKAEEILLISDEKGLFPVTKIRNKTFGYQRFSEWVNLWQQQFS